MAVDGTAAVSAVKHNSAEQYNLNAQNFTNSVNVTGKHPTISFVRYMLHTYDPYDKIAKIYRLLYKFDKKQKKKTRTNGSATVLLLQ